METCGARFAIEMLNDDGKVIAQTATEYAELPYEEFLKVIEPLGMQFVANFNTEMHKYGLDRYEKAVKEAK